MTHVSSALHPAVGANNESIAVMQHARGPYTFWPRLPQDLYQAWVRAAWAHWNTFCEIRLRQPPPQIFALIRVTMSDATFSKLIKEETLQWKGTGCCRMYSDIDRRLVDAHGDALYSVVMEMKAAPRLTASDYPA